MYYYILGCGIACLVLFGIGSMDTGDVKPAEIICKTLLWPVTLVRSILVRSNTSAFHRLNAAR